MFKALSATLLMGCEMFLNAQASSKQKRLNNSYKVRGASAEKLVKKLEDSKFILDKVTDKDDVIGRK
jgi:hypothetical protein